MLQTLPVSSNSEVLIMFPEQFDIDSWIIEVSTFYCRKKLRSLTYVHHIYIILDTYVLYFCTITSWGSFLWLSKDM